MAKTLPELIEAGERHLEKCGYAQSSRYFYRRGWSEFGTWCEERGIPRPTREDAESFVRERGWDEPSRYVERQLARAVRCLLELDSTGSFPRAYKRSRILVPDGLRGAYDAYEAHLGSLHISQRTVYSKMHRVKRFLSFLAGIGVTDIRRLSAGDVEAFLPHAGEASSSRSGNLYELRAFLRFCVGALGCDQSLASMFPTILERVDGAAVRAVPAVEGYIWQHLGVIKRGQRPDKCSIKNKAISITRRRGQTCRRTRKHGRTRSSPRACRWTISTPFRAATSSTMRTLTAVTASRRAFVRSAEATASPTARPRWRTAVGATTTTHVISTLSGIRA